MRARRVARRLPRRKRNRGYGMDEMEALSDSDFQSMFRIKREWFNLLLEAITPAILRNEDKARNSSGSVISPKTKLAVTLRWLAGGHYRDLMFSFGVSKAAIYSTSGILWPTITALDKHLTLTFPINNIKELQRIGDEFGAFSPHGIMQNCVGAIDGLLIRTRAPYRNEHSDGAAFKNRKKCFGILAMGVADVQGKFLSFAVGASGSTHDSIALELSTLGAWLKGGDLPEDFFLIGDDAFACTRQLLCPWPGRGIGADKDAFNYFLSHSRQCIERAFGMLVKRWGIFWRKFMFDFERWPLVALVCAKLHNVCCDDNLLPPPRFHRDLFGHHKTPAADEVLLNDVARAEGAQRATGQTRKNITDVLQDRRITRPRHASCNARA